MRVACYIDGFNLYHAINDLQRPHLKWVNLWSLAESLCRPGEELIKVAYFTAYATWKPSQYARHREYVAALRHSGVECHVARFSEKIATCLSCKSTWKQHEEKETDVHFSLTLLEDAIDDVFDRAIIVSADSDHVPAVRKVRGRYPGKQVFIATPPERHGHARELLKAGNSGATITRGRIAKCLLPEIISDGDGAVVATRPPAYAPPA
ncbi:NYN domain-containing protein [Devosia geojensis]|uniref:NYN domain-containing protein n=1 Tax=Devosia geojensis TaxID=443610 RepID=UPI000A04243A|nr:NYN domain-containing protein [Devosia geojensis]